MKEKRIIYDCPLCDQEHEIIIRTILEETDYKNQIVKYENTSYICQITGEEFAPIKVLSENLSNIRKAYIKKVTN